jgi:long-chain acyl-CoA synthetase
MTASPHPPWSEHEPGTPEYWADKRPDVAAIIDGDRRITYAEWNDQANRLADALADLGVTSGDRMGVRFQLCAEWFVLQRALQKLGVGQVGISWKLKTDEVRHILRDSGASGMACTDPDPARWAIDYPAGLLITVGQPETTPIGHRIEDLIAAGKPTRRYGSREPLSIIYTSGTTGAPRGIDFGARVDADPEWTARYRAARESTPPFPPNPISLITMPVNHGSAISQAVSTCARGGTAVVLHRFDAEQALRLIERHRVQRWALVPTMLLRLANLPDHVLDKYDLSSLQVLVVGAAPVPQSVKQWVIGRFGNDLLWERYGATEVGMISATPPEYQLTKPNTSGKPFDGVDVAIVDQNWNHLPTHEAGEIAVRSPAVLRGYIGQDHLPDNMVKDGYCRTGDIGHLDEDGFIFITDRAKDMVVAGGVNIYPAEIEKVLVGHPSVLDAAVIGIPQDDFGEQPLAFIVPVDRENPPGEQDLTAFVESRLAKFKWPRHYVYLDELPTNATGKVLKTQLRKPYWEGRERNV